jgi:hypothetical protein
MKAFFRGLVLLRGVPQSDLRAVLTSNSALGKPVPRLAIC